MHCARRCYSACVPSTEANLEALQAGRYAAARDGLKSAIAPDAHSARGRKGLVQATRCPNGWQHALWALDAVAHADHGLPFATLDDQQPGFLLLCRALNQQGSTLSVGPVSRFFNARHTTDGSTTLAPASEAWPHLRGLVGDPPFEDPTETAAFVRSSLPRAKPPSWWGR